MLPCLLLALLVCLGASVIAPLFNVAESDLARLELAIGLFAWALPLWATLEISTSALRACQAFGPEIRLRLLWEQLCRLLLTVILWLAGIDTLALLIAHLGSLAITTCLALKALDKHCSLGLVCKAKLDYKVIKDLLLSGLSVMPANVMGRMFVDLPVVILNFGLPGAAGANAAGLYSIARKLASIPQLVRSVFSHVVSPVAAAGANREFPATQALYTFSIRISILLALPTATMLIATSDSLLLLFVTGAGEAWSIVVILTTARGIEAALGPATALQQVISHRGLPLLNSMTGCIAAAVILFLVFPLYPTTGVALAVATGQLLIAALSVWQLAHREKLKPFDGRFYSVMGGSFMSCGLIVLTALITAVWPVYLRVPAVLCTFFVALWVSLRFTLPAADRSALGKAGRWLRLSTV